LPSLEPSSVPTEEPSVSPSKIPTEMPSSKPSASFAPTASKDVGITDSHVVALEKNVLLTFLMPAPATRGLQKNLRRSSERSLQADDALDRSELLELTSNHVFVELQKLMARPEDVHSVHLIVTPVLVTSIPSESAESEEKVLAVTEAIDGNVAFSQDVSSSIDSASLQSMVEKAFEDAGAMERYIRALEQADDPILRTVKQVHVGLPSEIDSPGNNDPAGSEDPNGSKTQGGNEFLNFEWNAFWISIVSVAGVVFLGIVAATYCLCRRAIRRRREYREEGQQNLKQAKSSITQKSSADEPNDGDKKDGIGETASPSKYEDGNDAESVGAVDISDDQSCSYAASDVTSVYSYLEGNTTIVDDQSYSIAPSLMYGSAGVALPPGAYSYDDETDDDQSRAMWSVADGLAVDDRSTVSSDYGIFTTPVDTGENANSKDKKEGRNDQGRVLVFGDDDDDDDLSTSDFPLPVIDQTETLKIIGAVERKQAVLQEVIDSPDEKIGIAKDIARSDDAVEKDGTALDLSVHSDASSKASKKSWGISARRKEGKVNDVADNVSDTSSKGSSKSWRRFARNKENSTSTANKGAQAEMSLSCESSDDDSSLFLGPGVGNESILTLSDVNKVDVNNGGARLDGISLPNGDKGLLGDDEKRQLGLLSVSDDESDVADSILLPASYATSPEKKRVPAIEHKPSY